MDEEDDAAASLQRQRPDKPEEKIWHAFYWRAWGILRSDRQYGSMGGQSPISFLAFDAYAKRFSIEGTAFDTFLYLMMSLDAEYLEHVAAELKKEQEAEKARSGNTSFKS